ncbi:MAG TPA: class I tRNA ligase family protein [Chloroflexia bacterium]|nr:class I tRNA ligase family protein [Chloroflexia bacterium]
MTTTDQGEGQRPAEPSAPTTRPIYYISTAIPYVNGRPHIGHALEFTQTDTFARYHRQHGADVYFLTGSDENSLKNVQAAEAEGVSTRELVDRYATVFEGLRPLLNLSFDQFIRTSADPRHAAGAARLWEACAARGDIYQKTYRGLYCVGCEQFYTPDELTPEGLCPEHLTRPDAIEEENYFFRLSNYGPALQELIESGKLRIIPDSRRNEVLSFIRMGLEDFSISRSVARARGWGVPVPGDPGQVMYVWFDALTNYITALDYATDGPLYQRYWAHSPARVNTIGKGVIRFHAVYWPAMLLSAGVLPPSTLFVHGYIGVGGQKMSKSLGNVVDAYDLVEKYGAEAVRYFFLREVPPTADADFTYEKFEARYNSDLANDLGNLLNRAVSMIHRYRGGVVPAAQAPTPLDGDLITLANGLGPRVEAAFNDYDPQAALSAIWELVKSANQYVEQNQPWTLAKAAKGGDTDAEARLDSTLYNLAEALRVLGVHLTPFLPATAAAIIAQLGREGTTEVPLDEALRWGGTVPGTSVAEARPLFPRLQ